MAKKEKVKLIKDRGELISQLFVDGMSLQYASKKLLKDEDIVSMAVNKNGLAIQFAPKWQNDRFVAFQAFSNDYRAAEFISKKFLDDEDFMRGSFYSADRLERIQYASDRLKDNKEFFLDIVKIDGMAIQYASDRLKDDKDVVLVAIDENGRAIQFASERLRNDKDIAFKVFSYQTYNAEYLSEEIKDDKDFILEAIKLCGGSIYKYISERLQNDKDIALAAVCQNCDVFEYIPDIYKDDLEFIMKAMVNSFFGGVLPYVSERWWNNSFLKTADNKDLNIMINILSNPENFALISTSYFEEQNKETLDFMLDMIAEKLNKLPDSIENQDYKKNIFEIIEKTIKEKTVEIERSKDNYQEMNI